MKQPTVSRDGLSTRHGQLMVAVGLSRRWRVPQARGRWRLYEEPSTTSTRRLAGQPGRAAIGGNGCLRAGHHHSRACSPDDCGVAHNGQQPAPPHRRATLSHDESSQPHRSDFMASTAADCAYSILRSPCRREQRHHESIVSPWPQSLGLRHTRIGVGSFQVA